MSDNIRTVEVVAGMIGVDDVVVVVVDGDAVGPGPSQPGGGVDVVPKSLPLLHPPES